MHHTDYSHDLRKTRLKRLKTLSPTDTDRYTLKESGSELLKAACAALLVIAALAQMDPANAYSYDGAEGLALPHSTTENRLQTATRPL